MYNLFSQKWAMKDLLEIHEFFVEGQDQERSHVLLHITEPGTPEERAKGYFFAIVEITNGSLEQIEHLQQMIDDLESGYYETDDQENKSAFEITLEFINRRGHHLLQYKNSVTNFLVGVLRDHELALSYHGTPQAWLFYKENDEFKEMNILSEEPIANGQLFSAILQGTINDGDYFYIATPHITDYFTADRIKKILLTRNTRQSASHIQKVLNELNTDISFGGILFHHPDKLEMQASGQKPFVRENGSVDSLNKMANVEQTTKEMLSSPLLGHAQKNWRLWLEKHQEEKKKKKLLKLQSKRRKEIESTTHGTIETNFRPEDNPQIHDSFINNFLVILGKSLVSGALILLNIIKTIIFFIGRNSIAIFLLITNKDHKRPEVLKEWRRGYLKQQEKWENLPAISKIILFVTIILFLIFISSILVYKIKQNLQAEKINYTNQVQAIIDKKNAAEAGILYNDNVKALTLLQEAKNLIANLPDNKQIDKEQITNLGIEIENNLNKIRKIINPQSQLVTDLITTNPQAKTENLAIIDNSLIAYGKNDSNLYKVDLVSKKTEAKTLANIFHPESASTPKEQDTIIFINGDQSLAAYSKDSNNLLAEEISFPVDKVNLAAICVYNRRLYAIDSNNNQIYRHNFTQTGFDKGTDWLKDQSLNVRDAVSLAIDGDVFILKTSGEIIKLVNGNKTDFNISGLDPQLSSPKIIWTYNNVNNLYILEPTNKRVVVLDKTGKLLAQFTDPAWQNPTGIIVQEDKKLIYILDNNKIYQFNINL